MADKQQAPQAHEDPSQPGSLWEAQSAILGLLEPEEETPKEEEAKPEESEESTLQTFFNIINHPGSKDARFIHYNGMGFDIPF